MFLRFELLDAGSGVDPIPLPQDHGAPLQDLGAAPGVGKLRAKPEGCSGPR